MQVPQLKRRLEQLLIMTKGLLQSLGATQHILVGNLRHKDLAGQVVPSQAYRESSSDEEADEEEDAEDEPAPGQIQVRTVPDVTRLKHVCMLAAPCICSRGMDQLYCTALHSNIKKVHADCCLHKVPARRSAAAGAEPSASRQTSPAAGSREQVSAAAYAVKAESEEPDDYETSSAGGEEDQ